ncbi:MAG: hypothetical protein K2O18_09180 [Oscillospiraceae bacterium]|nr:hypothetical protein [Oscillospiraceae bacterium]
MARRNKVKTEVRRLTSGYWAVFIGGIWVDAASPSKKAAQVKLNQFLLKMKGETK